MNIDYDGLEQKQRIKKIALGTVTNEELLSMLKPYLERRKTACELYEKNSYDENIITTQELERLINYCNIQIKLILMLN